MTTPKLCSDCIHYHVPASKEPCRDCLPQTVAVPNFKHKPAELIERNGVECDVNPQSRIYLRLRNGSSVQMATFLAGEWNLNLDCSGFDVVSYKVIE